MTELFGRIGTPDLSKADNSAAGKVEAKSETNIVRITMQAEADTVKLLNKNWNYPALLVK